MSAFLHVAIAFVAGAVAGFVAGYLVRRRHPSDPVSVPGVPSR